MASHRLNYFSGLMKPVLQLNLFLLCGIKDNYTRKCLFFSNTLAWNALNNIGYKTKHFSGILKGTITLFGGSSCFIQSASIDEHYNKNQWVVFHCVEIQVNCFCVRIFHEFERWYPFTKSMNLISRQEYITNWFLFLCCNTFVMMILMFNVQF